MEQPSGLYDSLASEIDLRKLVADRVGENIYLEFKTKGDRSTGKLGDGDARQFSRALSGFANSDGGVLIWGIETNKNDQAWKRKPISKVYEFQGRLKKSLLNAVQPFVDGVQIDVIAETKTQDSGYVKCLIPRSDKAPHRAMLAAREYYRRSTEGFYRLEHFDLEDMFGRRPHPSLVSNVEIKPRPGDDPHEEVTIAVRNEGRGIARYTGLFCQFDRDVEVLSVWPAGMQNLTRLNKGIPTISFQDNTGVIHANGISIRLGIATIKRPAKGSALSVHLTLDCEGMASREFHGSVEPESPNALAPSFPTPG